jgi:hypothetical protein
LRLLEQPEPPQTHRAGHGSAARGRVLLAGLERMDSLDGFEQWLRRDQAWLGGFDFPFGLPRELVEHLGWPTAGLIDAALRGADAARDPQTPLPLSATRALSGGKFAHRAASTSWPAPAPP